MNPGSPSIFHIIRRYGKNANKLSNDLLKLHLQLTTIREQLKFNLKCKRNNILPKSLRFRPPIRNPQGYYTAKSCGRAYLKVFIAYNHSRINEIVYKLPIIESELKNNIPSDIFNDFMSYVSLKNNQKKLKFENRLVSKFNNLVSKTSNISTNEKAVKNISHRVLNDIEIQTLSKGLNYSIKHSRKDILNTIASIEPVVEDLKISDVEKNAVRHQISNCLMNIPKSDNLTSEEFAALKSLRDDESIRIVKSDKGNCTVILDTVEYNNKVEDHLNDVNTYCKLSENPMKKLQNAVNNELKKLSDLKLLDRNTYLHLRASTHNIPLFYGLIKIHKPNNPIRPIVSFIDSPTYNLAKFLSKLLMPSTEKSHKKLKNSFETKEFLKAQIIPPDHSLVSFDVKSLFTCLPHSLIMTALEKTVVNDNDIATRTLLRREDIIKLVKICLESTAFQWNSQIFGQKVGTPMGSPISVVLAELTLQYFENEMLESSFIKPVFWKRYVDDVISCVETSKSSSFLAYLNSVNVNIKFDMEMEENQCLNYLDLKIKRNQDNSLSFGIFRKETHTGKYLDFSSKNPTSHKRSVAYSLFNRCKQICDSKEEKKKEDEFIWKQLKENNYPNQLIRQCHSKINNNEVQNNEEEIRYVKTPYIHGASERISRILKPYGVKLGMKPSNSIKSKLGNLKDEVPFVDKNSVVYKLECKDCNSCYIGETGRQLGTRLTEHRSNIRNLYNRSQLVEHITSYNHSIDFENASILGTHKHDRSRKVLEACYTHVTNDTLNRALEIPQTYCNITQKVFNSDRQ